jgi:integrase
VVSSSIPGGCIITNSRAPEPSETLAKPHLKLVTPATVNRTVMPRRRPNADLRTREHLTVAEVERLIDAAKGSRHGHRDATMLLVAYRHGLRAAELVDLRWVKSTSEPPPCTSAGSRRARPARIRLSATNCGRCGGFNASRTRNRRSCSRPSAARRSRRRDFSRMVERAGVEADLGIKVYAHMLRHATGVSSPTIATTPGRSRPIWGTPISRTTRATPRSHPVGSRASSTTDYGA